MLFPVFLASGSRGLGFSLSRLGFSVGLEPSGEKQVGLENLELKKAQKLL